MVPSIANLYMDHGWNRTKFPQQLELRKIDDGHIWIYWKEITKVKILLPSKNCPSLVL